MVVDLTKTRRFYDCEELKKNNIHYIKLECQGFDGFIVIVCVLCLSISLLQYLEKQTDRQTDQIDRRIDRQTDRQTD